MHSFFAGASLSLTSKDDKVTLALSTTPKTLPAPHPEAWAPGPPAPEPSASGPPFPGPPIPGWSCKYWISISWTSYLTAAQERDWLRAHLSYPATEPSPSLLTSLEHNFNCNHCENSFKNHRYLKIHIGKMAKSLIYAKTHFQLKYTFCGHRALFFLI